MSIQISKSTLFLQISWHFLNSMRLVCPEKLIVPRCQGMRWRHAWIIKRRTFWSLLFQHLPRSFSAVKNGTRRYTQLPTALGTGTWCVWSKRKQQCHPLWCKDLESMGIHGKTRKKRIERIDVHTQVSNSRVCFWFGPENEKATELGLSPQFFVRLVPNSAKTGCVFSLFSRLKWSRIHWVRCQNTGKPVDHEGWWSRAPY